MIRVLLAEDQGMVRGALAALLRLDEAVALRRIEPLNGALRHSHVSEIYQQGSVAQSGRPEKGSCNRCRAEKRCSLTGPADAWHGARSASAT